MRSVDFPYRTDSRGRTAETRDAEHIRDLIEQLLFTTPGERVMRPDFGAGLLQLVFQPTGEERAAATQTLVQSVLQQFLGDLIEVRDVEVTTAESRLDVRIDYAIRETGADRSDTFGFGAGDGGSG